MALYRYKTEQKLKEKEEWLGAILRNVQDAGIMTSAGVVASMNPAAEQLTGWSQAEAAGKNVSAVFNVSSIGASSHLENAVTEILAQTASGKLEKRFRLLAKHGGSVFVDVRAVSVRADPASVEGVALIFRQSQDRM